MLWSSIGKIYKSARAIVNVYEGAWNKVNVIKFESLLDKSESEKWTCFAANYDTFNLQKIIYKCKLY